MLQTTIENVIDEQQLFYKRNQYYVPREIAVTADDLQAHAVVISGIRRCGKSSLQMHLSEGFTTSLLLNFEDTRLFNFTVDDFEKLLRIINSRNYQALFFDEIQIVAGWEIFVRQLLDGGFKVCVTGSNASLLSKELGTKLTGRHLTKELFPFSFSEFLLLQKKESTQKLLEDYLETGGFPEYIKTKNQQIVQSLFNDILVRDIAVRYGIRDIKSLQNLASYLISNVGKLVSAPKLKSITQVKASSTILDYLGYLEQSWLFFYVPKFSHSLKSQSVNPKKVYCIDNGLIKANSKSFTQDDGRKLENLVFLTLRRRGFEIYYFAENGECDFVVFSKNTFREAIQVCWNLNEDNLNREVNGLIEALKFFNTTNGKIITLNQNDNITKDGKSVEIISLMQFLS